MGTYAYRAVDGQSAIREGKISAATVADVERLLTAQGLTLIEAESAFLADMENLLKFNYFSVKFNQKELLDFTYLLKLVISSGIPIMHGINDLMSGHSSKKITFVAREIYQGVDSGLALSEVMASLPLIFPGYYVQLIHAGEASGTLEKSLDFLMNYISWQIEFKKTVKGALTYPATILAIMTVLMVVIFTVVFPKMLKMLTGLGGQLPLPTRIMITLSDLIRGNLLAVVIILAVLYAAYQIFRRTTNGRRSIDKILLKIPLLGNLILKVNMSRYFKTIAILHGAGLSIERTFTIGAEVTGNSVLAEKLSHISMELMAGESISDAMRRTGYVQPLVADMISLAEKTGRLEEALIRASDILDKEVPETIKKLVSLIEPLSMALLGGMVLLLLLSVFLPIYKMVGQVRMR